MPRPSLKSWLDAAEDGDVEGLRVEWRRGIYINSSDGKGRTALYFAALEGHDKAVRHLLDRAADASRSDRSKRTPLHLACQGGFSRTADLLLTAQTCKINAVDDKGDSAAWDACWSGNVQVVRLLSTARQLNDAVEVEALIRAVVRWSEKGRVQYDDVL
jgi:ankyrin repeat protein